MENSQEYKVLRKDRVVPMRSVRRGEESSQEDSLEKVSLNSWMERKKEVLVTVLVLAEQRSQKCQANSPR
jgi:hypothetical protein